jgi:hypothetical protein
MKVLITCLLIISPAFAQIPSVPCIPPPAPPAQNAANQSRGVANGRASAQQPAAEVAEIAKLMNLPSWGQNLADGDYSNGPAYPTAPELAKRAGVPEGKVIEFVMNSAQSKFYPGANGAFQRHVCVYVP